MSVKHATAFARATEKDARRRHSKEGKGINLKADEKLLSSIFSEALPRGSDEEILPESQVKIDCLVSMPTVLQAMKVHSSHAEKIFHDSPGLSHIVIVDDGRNPSGLLTRSSFYIKTGGAYGYALFANKYVDSLATSDFLKACWDEPILNIAAKAMERQIDTLYDPIIVIDKDSLLLGTVTVKDLLRSASNAIMKGKQRAEEAARLKSEFLSAMSHEIRTPLNAIINMAKAIAGTSLDNLQRECSNTIVESSKHLLSVVNNILDFSKLEVNKLSIEKISFNLQFTLRYCVKAVTPQAEAKGLKVELLIHDGMPEWIKGDPLRLRQVVLNLLGNAIKFTSSGRITLEAAKLMEMQNGSVQIMISVADTGIGIPKNRLRGIFARFTQADSSTSRMYGGSGLGLSICRQLVKLMGGTVWAESQEGKGSKFSFTIKVLPGIPEDETSVYYDPLAESYSDGPCHVSLNALIVDDNPFNIKVASLLIPKMGHTLNCVYSGKDAMAELSTGKYDIVLTDIEMPGMDGFELVSKIRKGEAGKSNANIPVIALSAHIGESWLERCSEVGMDGYISKPIDSAELAALFRKFPKFRQEKGVSSTDMGSAKENLTETQQIFDASLVKDRLGGDLAMIDRIREIFRTESRLLLESLEKAVEKRDMPLIGICAHSLKGNAASVAATKCMESAKALEDTAKSGCMEGCPPLTKTVILEFRHAIAALDRKAGRCGQPLSPSEAAKDSAYNVGLPRPRVGIETESEV